jgi:hypothetical protein
MVLYKDTNKQSCCATRLTGKLGNVCCKDENNKGNCLALVCLLNNESFLFGPIQQLSGDSAEN